MTSKSINYFPTKSRAFFTTVYERLSVKNKVLESINYPLDLCFNLGLFYSFMMFTRINLRMLFAEFCKPKIFEPYLKEFVRNSKSLYRFLHILQ